MQSKEAQCFSILVHEPTGPATLDRPKFNPDLEDVPGIYHEFADVFSKQKADTVEFSTLYFTSFCYDL